MGLTAQLKHTITEDDLRHFVELTGDDNLLHTDPNFAAKTSFKKPVVHGMLGASFISTIIGTKLPGDGALWFAQNLEFHLPVRIGDTLSVRAEIIHKDERSRMIELQTDIYNQNRQKVTSGIAKVKIIEPEPEEDSKELILVRKKVALVIGGSGGIGSAVCLSLANEGFDVAVHYFKNINSALSVSEKIIGFDRNAKIFCADIQNPAAVNDMVESVIRHYGPISVLVNCSTARISAIKFSDLHWNDFQEHLENQIKGTFNLVRSILPYMEKEKYGKIITLNSQALDSPSTDWLPYITAKGALLGFTRALAFDLAPKGIRVNSVSPGMTDTDQISEIPERIRLVTAARTPLRRLAQPEDIAKAITFLASEQSDFLCGETIRVNGGQVMI
ncbi:MAG: SDR family oxidoreductase [Bacteroidia bacterium]|nr:SDR family oxidoreductase [Bacteroidia bacterium]